MMRLTVVSDGRDWIRQSDWTGLLFFRIRCTSFLNHSPLLTFFLFHCLISILLFPCASVWKKHLCVSSPFSIAVLNGTCSLPAPILFCGDVPAIKQLNYKQTSPFPTVPLVTSLGVLSLGNCFLILVYCDLC